MLPGYVCEDIDFTAFYVETEIVYTSLTHS